MSGFFQVDLEVLQQFVSALRQSDEHTQTAMKAMASADATQIGTDALNSAADNFQKTWHYGVQQIGSMIKDTTDGVTKARDAYQQVEDGVGKALNEIKSKLG